MGRCRVVRAWADVESSRLKPILGRLGSGRCRVVRARANVELSELRMSSDPGPADVEPSWSASILVQVESN